MGTPVFANDASLRTLMRASYCEPASFTLDQNRFCLHANKMGRYWNISTVCYSLCFAGQTTSISPQGTHKSSQVHSPLHLDIFPHSSPCLDGLFSFDGEQILLASFIVIIPSHISIDQFFITDAHVCMPVFMSSSFSSCGLLWNGFNN